MYGKKLLPALCLLAAGCADTSLASRQDENVLSSLPFDTVPCAQLTQQRDALAARYALGKDARPVFTEPPAGFGPFTPDTRSKHRREAERASGEIAAMNRSIVRRQCEKPKAG